MRLESAIHSYLSRGWQTKRPTLYSVDMPCHVAKQFQRHQQLTLTVDGAYMKLFIGYTMS